MKYTENTNNAGIGVYFKTKMITFTGKVLLVMTYLLRGEGGEVEKSTDSSADLRLLSTHLQMCIIRHLKVFYTTPIGSVGSVKTYVLCRKKSWPWVVIFLPENLSIALIKQIVCFSMKLEQFIRPRIVVFSGVTVGLALVM